MLMMMGSLRDRKRDVGTSARTKTIGDKSTMAGGC